MQVTIRKYGTMLGVAAAACMTSSMALAQDIAPPSAYSLITPVADEIIALDGTRLLRLDPDAGSDPQWQAVTLPLGARLSGQLKCAEDGSGYCAIGLSSEAGRTIGIMAPGASAVSDTRVAFRDIIGVFSANEVILATDNPGGGQIISVLDGATGEVRDLDLAGVDGVETIISLPFEGGWRVAARRADGRVRFLGESALRNMATLPQDTRYTASGVSISYPPFYRDPQSEEGPSVYLLQPYLEDEGGIAFRSTFYRWPTAGEYLMLPRTVRITSTNDLLMLSASQDDIRLAFTCSRGEGSHAVGRVGRLANLAFWELIGGGQASGVVLRGYVPGAGEHFSYIRLGSEPLNRIGARDCSVDSALALTGLPIRDDRIPDGWILEPRAFTTASGQTIQAALLRRHGDTIDRLVIHSYGASGVLSKVFLPPDNFFDVMEREGIAILMPLLPGDGNLGWDFAASSRAPNRSVAVEALADVAQQARAQLLSPNGRLILRGISAGGWLSIMAAREEDGLADEVIAIASAYVFPRETQEGSFFSPDDGVTPEMMAGCTGTFFRLLHGTEDEIVPFVDAVAFGRSLSPTDCRGALHVVDNGKHGFYNGLNDMDQATRDTILYRSFGLEPPE